MYEVVFDIADEGYRQWTSGAFGIPFIVIGVGLLVFRRRLARSRPAWFVTAFAVIFLGFSVIWTVVAFVSTYSEYSRLMAALENGTFEVVEGPVTDFEPMPYGGHAMERFVVDGQRFEYSDFVITAGFNNTRAHGGPIEQGAYVRVWHVDGAIIRLEVHQ